jgi:hypothetical protein
MTINENLPQRVHQTIKATKAMPAVFFNPKELIVMNLLPQGMLFTTVYFVDNVIILLASRHAQPLGDITLHKLHLHLDNSKCHTVRHVQNRQSSMRLCSPSSVFT